MGLFDKKICSVCGKEIGLLGNRKLADGNLCKDCASQLSPWFSDRKSSTIAEIKEQIAYREENKKKVSELRPTIILGPGSTKIHLDEKSKNFIVTRSSSWQKSNPDVINLSQVRDCVIDVKEEREEVFLEKSNGEKESYDPPRFTYEYKFNVKLDIDSPFYPEIKFELAEFTSTNKNSAVYSYYEAVGRELQSKIVPGKLPLTPAMQAVLRDGLETAKEKDKKAEYEQLVGENTEAETTTTETSENVTLTKWFCPNCGTECHGNFCVKCGNKKPEI